MAASPNLTPASNLKRRFVLTPGRLEANRRNAKRSTGPRTAQGKARVARNPVKHGFFTGPQRWTPAQHRDFAQTLDGLRDDFRPQGVIEESCVALMAESYVRMAAMLRYENIAALKYHRERERELNERIAAAEAPEAACLEAERGRLIAAGLWRPILPGPREMRAIIRYSASLDWTIHRAISELDRCKELRGGVALSQSKVQQRREASPNGVLSAARRTSIGTSPVVEVQKQTHCSTASSNVLSAARRTSGSTSPIAEVQKQTHCSTASSNVLSAARRTSGSTTPIIEDAKTNPLSSMFTGNRHQRRRAKALAARRH